MVIGSPYQHERPNRHIQLDRRHPQRAATIKVMQYGVFSVSPRLDVREPPPGLRRREHERQALTINLRRHTGHREEFQHR